MPWLTVILDGENCWPELHDENGWKPNVLSHDNEATALAVAALPGGMQSGRTSVTLRVDLTDGTVVLAETSLRLFLAAARAFAARFPEEVDP